MKFAGVKRLIHSSLMWLLGAALAVAEPMKVSALHPLMADLARQVGGERVRVFDLVGEGGNPHRYEPRPADLKQMQASALVLAGGKHLEPYLDRLKSTLGGVTIVEVGRTIPSLTVGKDAVYTCCPRMRRARWTRTGGMASTTRAVPRGWWHRRLRKKIPPERITTWAMPASYGKRLDALKKWAKSELAKVPRGQRKLVTAHNAFGYFAKEFGFEVIAVAGLTKEQNTTPQEQAKTIESVKQSGVRAVFPELGAGRKPLEAISTATGTRVGTPLIADGNGTGAEAGFEAMIRHNVNAITRALAAP